MLLKITHYSNIMHFKNVKKNENVSCSFCCIVTLAMIQCSLPLTVPVAFWTSCWEERKLSLQLLMKDSQGEFVCMQQTNGEVFVRYPSTTVICQFCSTHPPLLPCKLGVQAWDPPACQSRMGKLWVHPQLQLLASFHELYMVKRDVRPWNQTPAD